MPPPGQAKRLGSIFVEMRLVVPDGRRQVFEQTRDQLKAMDRLVAEPTYRFDLAHERVVDKWSETYTQSGIVLTEHARRTGIQSALLAKALGWSPCEVQRIRVATVFHDIGKVIIPPDIVEKPGALSDDEMQLMQCHTIWGARLLADLRSPVFEMAQEIALWHHEHWDGGGYPSGLVGSAIPQSARIVAIADVFDALSHDRVYREALSQANVLQIMRQRRGIQFDPEIFDLFLAQLPELQAECRSSNEI